MKAIACLLCGGRRTRPLFEVPEFIRKQGCYVYAKCEDCDHIFLNPQPEAKELELFYTEVVPRLKAEFPLPPDASPESLADSPAEREKVNLIRERGILKQSGSVLDIGFGSGGFLFAMAGQGWRCTGVELTDRVELPFDPAGRFEHYFGADSLQELESEQFDLVTLWHVLEHLPNPVYTLRQVRRLVKPAGVVLIGVPNIGGLSSRVFGRFWYGLAAPWHLQQFTPRSLGLALCEAGLLLDEIRGCGRLPMHLCWTCSVSNLIDELSPRWYCQPLVLALRLLRRGVVTAMPILLRAECLVGLPGAIVAIGRKNQLAEAMETRLQEAEVSQ